MQSSLLLKVKRIVRTMRMYEYPPHLLIFHGFWYFGMSCNLTNGKGGMEIGPSLPADHLAPIWDH